ncbi:hypothetical protein BC941DRAFT_423609 [Chlamydoabsidia padenii]|nr:hypothetical protein BC941DRAFT_423609 [Chlamydoabsidia padenii]
MTHSLWLLIIVSWLFFCCELQVVMAQVSIRNPLIWQTLVTPLGNGYDYVSNSTVKYYSQDFQTIYSYSDNWGHNERILLNVGDGCNVPTYDDIVYYNNGVSAFMKRQSLMGLVSRGGCSWSTKINNLQTLVQSNSILTMTGVLIYDNQTYDNTTVPIIQRKPSTLMTSNWQYPLPAQRNISTMQDNDILSSNMSPFFAVYFSPYQFGLDMLAKMNNTTPGGQSSLNKQYVQLAPYFDDSVKDDNPSNSNNSNNDNGNGDDGSFNSMGADDLFGGGNRGYIAYLVASVAGIVMAIILFRWCRNPRFGARRNNADSNDIEAQVGMERIGHTQHSDQEITSIPIEKLNTMYAIQSAGEVMVKMKNSVCAICLDDFDPTSQIRLLPCHHGFCVGCIDIWLSKKSSLCPICKHDCCETTIPVNEEIDLGKTTSHPSTSTSPIITDETNDLTAQPSPLQLEEDLGTARGTSSSVSPPSYTSPPPPHTSEHQV